MKEKFEYSFSYNDKRDSCCTVGTAVELLCVLMFLVGLECNVTGSALICSLSIELTFGSESVV